jgi:hypothetical protein
MIRNCQKQRHISFILGYRLEYKISDSEDEYITDSYISSLDTNFTACDLYRGALYDFRLTAESHVGWGEAVSLQVFTDVIYRGKYYLNFLNIVCYILKNIKQRICTFYNFPGGFIS